MELDKNKLESSTRLLFTVGGYLDTLLSHILCFLVLSAIALLVIFTVIVAMDDITKLRERQNLRLENSSETKTPSGRCYWPSDWCRILYNCDWKEPMRRQSTSKPKQTQQLKPNVPPCSAEVLSKSEIMKFLVHQHPRKELEQQPPVANELL
ncbi:uncharacterized protein LOC115761390 [Drosophila novamexicana]|uniref:uncharacterized protein LOC115761390 n=1 Tax=Drosophila novamexicana TaxID=47314 RepID=UPI0011E5B025|nr:uncharacterized protein LOC115761390 [Drosophila novamexicana]XP_030559004.1 uncharacterized protein LOC115761390 [Drosophila novamexicana]XP_030559005.1 uncharacterized protein LOC115761390 [Drosophila novamexicana]